MSVQPQSRCHSLLAHLAIVNVFSNTCFYYCDKSKWTIGQSILLTVQYVRYSMMQVRFLDDQICSKTFLTVPEGDDTMYMYSMSFGPMV